MPANPYSYGTPVSDKNFIGRKKQAKRVISRSFLKGESTAIVGDPLVGKTSFLHYIANRDMCGKHCEHPNTCTCIFSEIDMQMLGTQFTPAQFWEHALAPVKECANKNTDISLQHNYDICKQNSFGNFTLERLFLLLKIKGFRYILMLNEFDILIYHPMLNRIEFFGGLRALAARSKGAFALIIVSRTPLSHLNNQTQQLNPTGSPYFNFIPEITLGAFEENEVNELLSLTDRFTDHDKLIVRTLGGNHPFLLSAACAALWDAYEDGEFNCQLFVFKRLYRELASFFSDIWRAWTPEMRKAFTTVAVAHQAVLMNEKKFFTTQFVKSLNEWGPELNKLEECAYIVGDKAYEGGYRINAQIMLAWLADGLIKAKRKDETFGKWLTENGIDGAFVSISEKELFQNMVNNAVGFLRQGGMGIIDALTKILGVAKSIKDLGVC